MAAPRAIMSFCTKMQLSRKINANIYRNFSAFVSQSPTTKEIRQLHSSTSKFDSFNVQDTADFQTRVLESDKPVIVDFHASWCGPCKMLGPRLESVMLEYREKMHFAKVDIDENTDLALEYGVEAVPAVLGFKKGQIVERFIGLQDEDKIKSFVEKTLSS